MTTAIAPPATFAEAEVSLAESLPGYESRPQQQTLALAVETALASRSGALLAEAGCGTGKSLGYLIPSILSGQRVIVSTATKALQDQIANKDLPFLHEHLGRPFSYALLKGRGNYACMSKINDPDTQTTISLGMPTILRTLEEQAANSDFMAERDDFAIQDSDWSKITSSSEECPGKKECPFGQVCFAEKAKEKAKAAQVVVVNHALFLTDLKIKSASGQGGMLDEYDAVVFDEAHEIEEYAGSVFGSQFSEAGIKNMASEARNFAKNYLDGEPQAEVTEAVEDVLTALTGVWMVLKPGVIRQADLYAAADVFIDFTNALGRLSALLLRPNLLEMVAPGNFEKARNKRNRLTNKIVGLYDRFKVIVTGTFEDHVRWVEDQKMSRGDSRRILKVAPVTVAPILRDMLFEKETDPVNVVLTSATMSVGKSFAYIAGRLGIENYSTIDVGTPFDYAEQAALYVPKHLPDPGKEREMWASMAISEMGELVRASNGRALLLFTSYTAMKNAYGMLAPRLPYTCLMQGQMPNKALAEAFMADTHSVLFGTRSFMTGVDFQGEACSLVVVDKLPFPVPTEPLTEARCNLIKAEGGSDFSEYTVPVMTLVLKQAFGRLIRHRNDKGIVAILDPRLLSKGYGKGILNSLPPAQRMTTLAEVQGFFEEEA
jgi:ATP-dependent DNA helicase DinG